MGEKHVFHSKYKGWTIFKVTQDSGRVTYDIYNPNGDFVSIHERLQVARAHITYA